MRNYLAGAVLLFVLLSSCYAGKNKGVKVVTLAESYRSWNGDSLPNYPSGKPKITVLKITIPPKTKLPYHYHSVINSGVLLKGELKVVDSDNNALILKEGDAIVELVNKVHFGINETNRPATIIVFYAGTKDLPITTKVKAPEVTK